MTSSNLVGCSFVATVRGQVVDRNGPIIHVAEILETLEERGEAWRRRPRRPWIKREEEELRKPPRRLRPGGERLGEETARNGSDEHPSVH
jgi:hypothetical protein